MNYHKSRKYYKDFKENFEKYSYGILNKLCGKVYSTNNVKQFGCSEFGCSIKFPSEDKSKEMNTNIFYTITPDSLNKNLQKQSVEKLFFQDSEFCEKELNCKEPYYLLEFTKRILSN